jgi:superfamily I DNA/RNA helicase
MATHANPWIKGLNAEQAEAVLHDSGPLLILAGAGSGKTTVLVSRTGRIIEEQVAKPSEICVLTFTNKAAKELKHRVSARLGSIGKGIWAGTFHSFGLQILRKHYKKANLPKQFGILDASDAGGILREIIKHVRNSAKDSFDIEKLLSMMSTWRESGKTEADSTDEYQIMVEVLLPHYLKRLELMGVTDFDGLLLKPIELLEKYPEILHEYQNQFSQVMVDEFQDTNKVQMRLIQLLVESHKNVAVVGDDDQSIYGWRGACVSNILDFPHKYKNCKVVRLEQNYRSTPTILEVANQVIQKNEKRHGKILRPARKELEGKAPEVFVYQDEEAEAENTVQEMQRMHHEGIEYRDMAVLYRSNSQGGLLEAVLRHHQVPYSITGGTAFFERKEVKDVLAYLRCAVHPHDMALRRIINTPTRGIGETTIENLLEWSDTNNQSFLQACLRSHEVKVHEKATEQILKLLEFFKDLNQSLLNPPPALTVGELLVKKMREIGYYNHIAHHSKEGKTVENKWMVIEILGRVLDSFVAKSESTAKALKEFLDSMELRDQIEDSKEAQQSKVQLLTLHACKGLEFPYVFMIGLEEDIIPHRMLGQDISEERRLFYVGVTRAQKHLIMSRAKTRRRFKQKVPSTPSRFLIEIPQNLLTVYEDGVRPVQETERRSMLESFFNKLDKTIEKQKVSK